MSESKKFMYGGKNYELDTLGSDSSRILVWVRCVRHPDRPIYLGSVWHRRLGLGQALLRKVKRGQRTRNRCYECKQDEGMVLRAYVALQPLLLDDERSTP